MPANPASARLADALARELQAVQAFIALLRHEQTQLASGDTASLTALAAEKTTVAEELRRLADTREESLAALALPAGRAGMEQWIVSTEGSAYRNPWQKLLELAVQARMLNDTNGRLINLHLRHNQEALRVLTAASAELATYGPDGQQKIAGGGRSLGSA